MSIMPIWNTKELAEHISKTMGAKVKIASQGGDYDTETIIVGEPEEHDVLYIRGFDSDNPILSPDNVEVNTVELTDGQDSRGGLSSFDTWTDKMYIELRRMLHDRGFEVVLTLNDYF